jgi:hypothetical protein
MLRWLMPSSPLTVELERAALRAVRRSFDDVNGSYFRWALTPPSFELVDHASRLGRWVGAHRRIELARALLVEHRWGVLVEVLKHEMAHQYVDEVLGVHDEPSHGPAFRRVCDERGFDGGASGVPRDPGSNDRHAEVLDRIAKLLALAESSNQHEAQAAMSAAQRLMLRYNIEEVQRNAARVYTHRQIGEPTGRASEAERLLSAVLAEFFFVEVIRVPVWRPLEGRRGSVLEVCGTRENVELAEYVYAFLHHTAERLWREHRREHGLKGNTGRQSFVAGAISGFRNKLRLERGKSQSTGLVWVGDAGLESFFRRRHPSLRWLRHRSRRGSAEYAHGERAGREIVLHRGVAQGPSGGLRLLGSGRGAEGAR